MFVRLGYVHSTARQPQSLFGAALAERVCLHRELLLVPVEFWQLLPWWAVRTGVPARLVLVW